MTELNKRILYIGNNLTNNTKYPTTMDTLSRLLISENYTVIKSSNKMNKLFRLLDMCLSVYRNRNKIDYLLIDTFSTTNFYYALITSQIARALGIKYIPILHGGNLPMRLDKSKWFSTLIFKNSYQNIAPSNYLTNEFEIRGFSTLFIPNTIEIDKYKFKKRKNIRPNIFWIRAFKELYNPMLAIKVLKLIIEKYKDAKLCMVGPINDNSFKKTQNLVKEYNLENNVEFTGVLSKKEWHKKSEDYDICINTTNFDNTPVSIIESMALGLSIVSTDVGGIKYLIDDSVNGVLVEKDNAEEMAKKILEIIARNDQKTALNARFKVENFDWSIVKDEWKKILL
jgi:glycosyltransferase involved in cell wall biosynthesis